MPKMDNTAEEETEEYDYPSVVMNPTTEVDGFEWDVYPYDEPCEHDWNPHMVHGQKWPVNDRWIKITEDR